MTEPNKEEMPTENNVLCIKVAQKLPEHKMVVNLDNLDRAIIEAHQEDVFFLYNELAEKWGVTAATIRNRIKKLKALGVMDIILILNPYKVGYDTIALIGIKVGAGASPTDVINALQAIPGVVSLFMVTGRFDIFVQYVCPNLEEYRIFVSQQLRDIPGIATFESFIGLDLFTRKFTLGAVI